MQTTYSIIRNIIRDLVNNEQIEVSFSKILKPVNSQNKETEEWDGPLYLKTVLRFVYGNPEYERDQVIFFKRETDALKFLGALYKKIKLKDFSPLNDIRAFWSGVEE